MREGKRTGVSVDRPVKGETRSKMSNQSDVRPNDDMSSSRQVKGGGGMGGGRGSLNGGVPTGRHLSAIHLPNWKRQH